MYRRYPPLIPTPGTGPPRGDARYIFSLLSRRRNEWNKMSYTTHTYLYSSHSHEKPDKMTDVEIATVYKSLKPACDQLMKTPNLQTVTKVTKLAEALPEEIVQKIHSYILFPFTIHLKNSHHRKNSKLCLALLDGYLAVLSKSNVDSHEIFFQYYAVLVHQLNDKKNDNLVLKVDEDCALKVCQCITLLLVRLRPHVWPGIYTRSSAADIGQGIFYCIQIARSERYKALRISAVECVMALSTVHDDIFQQLYHPKITAENADQVGEILMFFLPGILGGLLEVILNDDKQGEKFTTLCIRAVKRIICIVMLDRKEKFQTKITDNDFVNLMKNHKKTSSNEPPEDYDPFSQKLRKKGKEGMMKHIETATRDEMWYKAAGAKLVVVIRKFRKVHTLPYKRVKLEVALLCSDFIEYCMVNMTPSLKLILELLIFLSESDDSDVKKISLAALKKFSMKTETGKCEIVNIVESNFCNRLSQVPRALHSLNYAHQESNLYLLKGHIRYLTMKNVDDRKPSRLEEVLTSSFIMNRFIFTLIEIFKMETRNVKLLEEYTIRDVCVSTQDSTPWRAFNYLDHPPSLACALEICHLLGSSDVVDVLTDFLFDWLKSNTENKKEIYLLLNEIVCGPGGTAIRRENLFKTLINTYIEPENWYLPMQVHKSEKPVSKSESLDTNIYNPRSWTKDYTPGLFEGAVETRYTDISYQPPEEDDGEESDDEIISGCSTLLQARDNVIQMCLLTEGVGMVAHILGDKFRPFLLKTLYLILERAGSSNEFLHLAGMKALQHITDAFKLSSISELIKINSDYFTHHVKVKLRKISDNSEVVDVLLVVMKFSESSVLPCLYDIVNNILHKCFGLNQQKDVVLYLRLFQTFLKYIKVKFTSEKPQMESMKAAKTQINILQELIDFKEQRIQSMDFNDDVEETENGELNEEDFKTCDNVMEEDEDPKAETPPHVKMVASVISKSLNFIPSKDRDQRLLALSIIQEGLPIIGDYEDISLPLVHEVWAPLVNRLKDSSQLLIMHRAFDVLVVLAVTSKDFIKPRTVKEVLPLICNFLRDHSKECQSKNKGIIYKQSHIYKLQLAILENISTICISLSLQEKQLNDVMEAASPYLSAKQPKQFQLACVNLFKQLMEHDPAQTWFYLISISQENIRISPPRLPTGSFKLKTFEACPNSSHKKLECETNIEVIFKFYYKLFVNSVNFSVSINSEQKKT